MVEAMDNGKPIRETRDADVPIVVRHFYHHAGWAQLMDTEMRGWQPVGNNMGQLMRFLRTYNAEKSPLTLYSISYF